MHEYAKLKVSSITSFANKMHIIIETKIRRKLRLNQANLLISVLLNFTLRKFPGWKKVGNRNRRWISLFKRRLGFRLFCLCFLFPANMNRDKQTVNVQDQTLKKLITMNEILTCFCFSFSFSIPLPQK